MLGAKRSSQQPAELVEFPVVDAASLGCFGLSRQTPVLNFTIADSSAGEDEGEVGVYASWWGKARWDFLLTYERLTNAISGSAGEQILYYSPVKSKAAFESLAQRLLCGFPDRTANYAPGSNEGSMTVWTNTDRNGVFWMPEVPCMAPAHHESAGLAPVAVVIKGHVRSSLSNSKLREALLALRQELQPRPMHLYVETWDWTEAKKSWRSLESKRENTERSALLRYFNGFSVRSLKIHSETSAPDMLKGSTTGNVGGSKAPRFNWKQWVALLWHGSQSVAASGITYGAVIHTRFDWLEDRVIQWMVRPDDFLWDADSVVPAIRACVAQVQPQSLAFLSCTGCDNMFVGGQQACAALADRLHMQLDAVEAVAPALPHQEQYVLLAADEVSRSWLSANSMDLRQGDIHVVDDSHGSAAVWMP
mmetsp:Transcript_33269/g.75811  ORF Transcript_33269/g.75811 Transcript_33269/m.75811 type:complete len:420 (-) Transcript_33269:113-1372(-)